jgi:hypothetical protein
MLFRVIKGALLLLDISAKGTRTACIYDHVQAVGPGAIKKQAHKGRGGRSTWRPRQAENIQDRCISTITRINLLRIPRNKLESQSISPIALIITIPPPSILKEGWDLAVRIQPLSFQSTTLGTTALVIEYTNTRAAAPRWTNRGLNLSRVLPSDSVYATGADLGGMPGGPRHTLGSSNSVYILYVINNWKNGD